MILLDAGHGGIIEGDYVTEGKRFYGNHKGREVRLAEGAWNRAIVHGIAAQLHLNGIPCHIINPENEDISLHARARRVNAIADKQDCILLSVHHNGFDDPQAHGFELFTSIGDTPADPIAEMIAKEFHKQYPEVRLRRDTIRPERYSKEAGYYILKSTRCPAILTEWGFMTNQDDRERIICLPWDQVDFLSTMMIAAYNQMN